VAQYTRSTTTFECDWKCGATLDLDLSGNTGRAQLNHAGVPHGWEKIYRVPSGYMTTDADSAKVPYILCPKCFRLFGIAAHGKTTAIGLRFRDFYETFLAAEHNLEELQRNSIHGTNPDE